MENEKNIICPTCRTEYPKESDQAKMVKDCGECYRCDHVRGEQFDDIPDEDAEDYETPETD